jgi:hypothetical protein
MLVDQLVEWQEQWTIGSSFIGQLIQTNPLPALALQRLHDLQCTHGGGVNGMLEGITLSSFYATKIKNIRTSKPRRRLNGLSAVDYESSFYWEQGIFIP